MRAAHSLLAAAFLLGAPSAQAADRAEAEALLVDSVNSDRRGESGAARVKLLNAIKADPDWALPHAVQASYALANGDGYGAETSVRRAVQLGLPESRTSQLLAHALLLQKKPEKALELARDNRVAPRFRGYAALVRAMAFDNLGDKAAATREYALSAELNPGSPRLWVELGKFRVSTGDLAGAIEATAQAVKLRPHSAQSLKMMGLLVRDQYGLSASIPWLRAALERDPSNLDLMRELAATLGDTGQTVEMLAMTREMLLLDPANPHAFYLQSVLAARARKYDLSRTLLYKTEGRLDQVPGVKLLRAALELEMGNAEQAIARLEDLVAEQPGNLKAQRLLGAALWRAGDANATIKALRALANRSDADSYTLSVIGRAYEAEGRRGDAAPYLDRIAEPVRGEAMPFDLAGDLVRLARANAGPSNNADFAVPYINKLVLEGRINEALAEAERLRAQNPGAPAAHVLVGDALMALGKSKEAADTYRNAAAIRFSEPVALRLIEALAKAGDQPASLRVLDLFLSQNPRSVPALLLAADHFLVTGQWDLAIDILEGLRARLGNRDAALLNSLGWAFFNQGNVEKALEMTGSAYAMVPSNPAFADSYGWVLYKSGKNREGGAALLAKAVGIAPGHPGLRFHLGQALVGLGRKDEARAHLKVAADNPAYPDAKKAAALLARL